MHTGVVVGINAHAEPGRLVETVRWLQFGGSAGGIELLTNGPEAASSAALKDEPTLTNLPQ
jgi:hypothetical protein